MDSRPTTRSTSGISSYRKLQLEHMSPHSHTHRRLNGVMWQVQNLRARQVSGVSSVLLASAGRFDIKRRGTSNMEQSTRPLV
jgi:hypothetical protein